MDIEVQVQEEHEQLWQKAHSRGHSANLHHTNIDGFTAWVRWIIQVWTSLSILWYAKPEKASK